MIDLTVVLATRNGADVLPRTLGGYVAVSGRDRNWKIIVVDNGSTDGTPEVLRDFAGRLPLTVLSVPTPGKNRALNAALGLIEGELVVFTDDDAVPASGFLDAWRAAKATTAWDVMGGAIEPIFERAPPDWLLRSRAHFDVLYAEIDRPDGPIAPNWIFGPNMAVRSRVIASGIRFPEDVGPNGAEPTYAMGSETAFCDLAAARGFSFGFVGRAKVGHIIRPRQVTPEFFRARAFRLGRGAARRQWETGSIVPRSRRSAVTFALGSLRRRAQLLAMFLKTLVPGEERRFEALWDFDFFRGFNSEHEKRRWAHRRGRNRADAVERQVDALR